MNLIKEFIIYLTENISPTRIFNADETGVNWAPDGDNEENFEGAETRDIDDTEDDEDSDASDDDSEVSDEVVGER
jgi:hypothetical protein